MRFYRLKLYQALLGLSLLLNSQCRKENQSSEGKPADPGTIVSQTADETRIDAEPEIKKDELLDEDGDGLSNYEEFLLGSFTGAMTIEEFKLIDTDKDGTENWQDMDSDDDGIADGEDPYPLDALDSLGPTFSITWAATVNADEKFFEFKNIASMPSGETRSFSNATIGISATISKLINDEWLLTVTNTGTNIIKTVTFPTQVSVNGKFRLNNNSNDDLMYFPFRLGKVTKAIVKDFTGQDSGHIYPDGGAFAPLTVVADDTNARIVAAVNFPPKRVNPYWDLKRQYLKFVDPIMPGGAAQNYRVLIKTVAATPASGQVPWQLALDAYKSRLKPWMAAQNLRPTNLPTWIKQLNGWITSGGMNAHDFRTNKIEANWNRWKTYFPWIQIWGQMSNYSGPKALAWPPLTLGEMTGCCLGITDMHPRYTQPGLLDSAKSLPQIADKVRMDGGRFGYYVRPRTTCDPFIPENPSEDSCPNGADTDGDGTIDSADYPLDSSALLPDVIPAASSKDYLINWITSLESNYGANATYIDVLACAKWASDPLFVPNLFKNNPAIFANAAHECQIDYYPSLALVSGALSLYGTPAGGEFDTTETMKTVAAPMFGRYIMDNQMLILGYQNGDNVYFGRTNNYWSERQAFIMGMKFDTAVGAITDTFYADAATAPMNIVMRQAIESRNALQWWTFEPAFEATNGIADVSAKSARVTKFKGINNKFYIAIDNFRSQVSTISMKVSGTARSYVIPIDPATAEVKLVAICPADPADGVCK